ADAGDADGAIRIAAALCTFWTIQGRRAESVAWLELALRVPGDAPPDARLVVRAMYLMNKAISGGFDNVATVIEPFREVVEEARKYLDHPLLALLEPMLALFTDDAGLG